MKVFLHAFLPSRSRFARAASLALALLAFAGTASAQLYWDNNGSTTGFGTATGTWAAPTTNDATQGWSSSSTGATLPSGTTTTATTDALNFGTSANQLGTGTITVSGNVSANTITLVGSSSNITLSGGNITLGGTSPGITVTNSANTNAITDTISSNITLGANQTWTVNNGGSTGTANLTVSGIISGSNLGITKAGNGTLTLSANNTYSGGTTISGGAVYVGSNSAFGTGNVTLNNISIGSSADATISNNITLTNTVTVGVGLNTSNLTFSGILSGSGTLNFDTNIGGVIITLTGLNTFTSNISAPRTASGIYFNSIADAGVASALGAGSSISTGIGSYTPTLRYTGNVAASTNRTISMGGGGLVIRSDGAALTWTGNITAGSSIPLYLQGTAGGGANFNELSGAFLAGNNLVIQAGSGNDVWRISGNNTHTGLTQVTNTSTMIAANANAFGTTAGATQVDTSGQLLLTGGIAVGAEALTLNSNASGTWNGYTGAALRSISGNNSWAGNITLSQASTIATDSGSNFTISGGISGANNLTVNSTGNTTISGIIGTSTGTLAKNGTGTLLLTANNSYSGATTINAGTLEVSSTGLLGGGSYSGNIANTGTLLLGSNSNQTLSGVISGSGAITKNGTGTLTISNAASTHNGTFTVASGTLAASGNTSSSIVLNTGARISAGNATAAAKFTAGSLTIGAGTGYDFTISTVNTSVAGTDYDQIAFSGAATFNNTAASKFTVYLNGTPTGWSNTGVYSWDMISAASQTGFTAGNFTTDFTNFGIAEGNRTGTWTFTNPSLGIIQLTYSGATGNSTWNTGTASWGTAGSWVENTTPVNFNNLTFNGTGGGTATNTISNGTLTTVNNITFASGAGAYTLAASAGSAGATGGAPLSVTGTIINNSSNLQTLSTDLSFGSSRTVNAASGNITISGNISGVGGIIKTGGNTLLLTGNNTYTGTTTISAGTLQVGGSNGNIAGAIVNNANLLYTSGNFGIYGVTGSGNLTINQSSGNVYLQGNITQSGTVNITTSAATTTSGMIQSALGTVNSNRMNTSITASAITINGMIGAFQDSSRILTLDTSASNGAITLDLQNGSSGTWNAVSIIANAGTGNITLSGTKANTTNNAPWIATTANSFTGAINISSSFLAGTLNLNATGNSSVSGSLTLGANSTSTWNVASGLTMTTSGLVSGNNASITKNGTGTLTLSANNTYNGTTTINGGTLQTTSTGLLGGGSYAANIANSGTFIIGANSNQTLSGVISGTGALTKNGTGTLTLSNAANTYNGSTTVNAGTLAVSGNISSSAITLNSGGVVSAGSAAAVAKFNAASLTISGDSGYAFTIGNISGGAAGTAGTDYDQIATSGAITFNNTVNNPFTIYINGTPTNWSSSGSYTWNILSGASISGFSAANFVADTASFGGSLASGASWTFGTSGGNLTLTYGASGTPTWAGGTGVWSGNFTPSLSNNLDMLFTGAGGVATNDIASGNLSSVGSITFNSTAGSYTLAANSGSAGNGTALTLAGSMINNSASAQTINTALSFGATRTINTASGNITIGGAISGAGGLTKTGNSTLTLSGANTYTGVTTVSAGTLALGANQTLGAIAGAGNLSLSNYYLTTNSSSSTTYSGVISGTGGLTKNGTGTLTLSGTNTYTGATTINAGTIVLNSTANANTAIIRGNVTVNAGATLVTSTDYTGFAWTTGPTALNINDGTVNVGNGANYGHIYTMSSGINFTGGTLQSNNGTTTQSGFQLEWGNVAVNTNASANTATIGGRLNIRKDAVTNVTFTVADGAAATDLLVSAAITESNGSGAGIIKAGAGQMLLTGNNTYTGTTTVNAGTLEIGSSGRLGAGTYAGAITNNGTLIYSGTNAQTLSGVISGTGALTQNNSSSTLTLSGTNTYTGATIVNAGTLQLTGAGKVGTGVLTVASGATLALNSNQTVAGLSGAGNITWNGGASTVSDGSALISSAKNYTQLLDFGNGGGATVNGVAFNSVTTSGTGWALTGAGTAYNADSGTGYNQLMSDFYYGGNPSALSFSGLTTGAYYEAVIYTRIGDWPNRAQNATFTNNGTTQYTLSSIDPGTFGAVVYRFQAQGTNASISMAPLNGANTFHWFGASLELVGNSIMAVGDSGNYDFSGAISGPIAITKVGTGTQTLSGNNTYTGATTINVGTLEIAAAGRLGGGNYSANITNNGTLIYSGTNNQTLSGIISGTGALTQNGASTLTLSGNNTYTGATTINAGTVVIGHANALGTTGNISFTGGGLQYGSNITTDISSRIKNSSSAILIDTNTNNVTFASAVDSTNSGGFTKNGTGTLTLSANNTYTGTTTINTGTLQIGSAGLLGSGNYSGNISNSGSFVFASNSNQTLGGVISGSGALTKNGSGTLTLTGNNSYSGATAINSGTLVVNGSAANSAVTIASGGILGGNGTVGALTVQSGGRVGPGNSPGNLNVSTLTLEGGGGYNWEIANVTGTAGSDWDMITVGSGSGAATINATATNNSTKFTIYISGNPVGWNTNNSYSWNIIDWGAVTGFDANAFTVDVSGFTGTAPIGTWAVSNTGGYLNLAYTAGDPTWNGGTGAWGDAYVSTVTGFSSSLTGGNKSIYFIGAAGGTVTNNRTIADVASLVSITFNSTAGAYTLAANSGSAGYNATTALQLNGNIVNNSNATQTINLALTSNATRTYDAAAGNITIGGVISGTGGVTKNGSNTLALTAVNTYSGDTTINAGTLAISGAGQLGSGNYSANIINAGTFNYASSANQTLGGTISGNGALTQSGASNLTLTGVNTYTGATTITAGTLTIGGAGQLGSGNYSGNIINNGVLAYNSSANQTLGGTISGTGDLIKNGNSTLTLSHANTYNGSTTVNAGTLSVTAANALGATTEVTIDGGSLLVAASNAINDAADITMGNNGTLVLSGSVGEVVGQFSLTTNSTAIIDMGYTASWISFWKFASELSDDTKLWIYNYTVGSDHVYIRDDTNHNVVNSLPNITFYSDFGQTSLGSGFFSAPELHPHIVPEPSTYATAALLLIGLGIHAYRRRQAKWNENLENKKSAGNCGLAATMPLGKGS